MLLFQLSNTIQSEDINTQGNDFHSIHGKLKGFYSVSVSENRQIILQFASEGGILAGYVDYH
jgi:plasmid maintenance system killer protein